MQAIDTQTAGVGDWIVDTNWSVYGADLGRIGTVQDVQPDYLVVGKGFFFRRARYIPVSSIISIERQCVYLNVSQRDIDDRGWHHLPDRHAGDRSSLDHVGAVADSSLSGSVRAT